MIFYFMRVQVCAIRIDCSKFVEEYSGIIECDKEITSTEEMMKHANDLVSAECTSSLINSTCKVLHLNKL